jgi:hypothetical protein
MAAIATHMLYLARSHEIRVTHIPALKQAEGGAEQFEQPRGCASSPTKRRGFPALVLTVLPREDRRVASRART